jgi:hypothetical protein
MDRLAQTRTDRRALVFPEVLQELDQVLQSGNPKFAPGMPNAQYTSRP